jgi:hypothetical protein
MVNAATHNIPLVSQHAFLLTRLHGQRCHDLPIRATLFRAPVQTVHRFIQHEVGFQQLVWRARYDVQIRKLVVLTRVSIGQLAEQTSSAPAESSARSS